MKDLLLDDRPREKLSRHGAVALGDNELVALVLGHGSRRGGALALANELLAGAGGVHGLARWTCHDLVRIAGNGRARAAQSVAALELGRRTLTRPPGARVQFLFPRDAAEYLLPRFGSRREEQFGIMLLDQKHRLLRLAMLAMGTLDTVGVEPRDVYREAMLGGAAAIIAFHNHPSGDPTPSPDDVELTRRLEAAGVLMGIDLVDHVVLGDGRYCSFKETGVL
ncbi:MAG: DNA repair protein RadC [Acidobacteria bacterium]|nr:DNA repair protein RadC [Acidobacteriota bacterium]